MNEDGLISIESICEQTWEPLYRYIYYKVQNREEAEDITQETYVKSLSCDRFIKTGNKGYLSFLKTVALNIIRDRWRQSKIRGTSINLDSVSRIEASADDVADTANQQIFIRRSPDRLSEEQRKVIELRIINGYSVAETAKLMNIKAGNVRVLQYRALKNLVAIMEEEDCHE